jgi:Bacterial conjugation TrbI-like protein
MTRYSIPSESSDNPDKFQPQTNSSDLESRMARLVGLEEPQFNQESTNIIQPSLSEPQSEPQEIPSKQSLSSNPFAKVGLVGTATLAMVVFAGGFLSQIMSGNNNKPTTNIVPAETRSQPKIEPQTQQQEAEIETLKTKLALAEQAEDVKAAQQKLRNQKSISPAQVAVKPTPQIEPRVATANRPTVVVQRIPTPSKTVYVPQIVTVDRPVKAPQPQNQFSRTVLPPVAMPPAIPNTQPSVAITPPAKPDSLQEWERLAKLGSYGQISSGKQNNTNNTNTTTIARVDNPNVSQPLIPPRPPSRIPPQQTYVPSQVSVRNPKSTAIGSSADAVLTTSVFGETSVKSSGDNSNNNKIALVKLREPLKAADGTIALPAKAEFLTKIRSISERGLVEFDIVKVTWQENGKRIERSVSGDALTIRGSGGQPLMANQYPGKGSSFGNDAKLFVLGGIQKAAELYNRPRSRLVPISTTSTTGGVSSTSTTTVLQDDSTRNITAGALDGAIRNIVPEMTRRSQQSASRSLERTNIWFLPAGREVQLFVNQEMQF